jgi:hypothetical protein
MEKSGLGLRVAQGIYLNENENENEKKPGLGRRIAQGIYLNENSNSNSTTSARAHNSNNNSLFEHNSNENSNASHENWTEKVLGKPKKKENGRVGFLNTRRVRRIDQEGKSRRNFWRHQTRTRKVLGNAKVNETRSNTNYAAARLVAAAHEKSHSFNEMVNFIAKARTEPSVKAAAVLRAQKKYKNLGATW